MPHRDDYDPALLDELEALVLELALEAAPLALEFEARRDELQLTVKAGLFDVATEADLAIEHHLRSRLAALRPGDVFLGEEEGEAPLGDAPPTGLRWVVDPIDGTTNFRYGFGPYGISIAVAAGPTTLAGAIAEPSRGELVAATLGRGAWLHSLRDPRPPTQVHARTPADLSEVLIDLSVGRGRDREQFPTMLREVQRHCMDVRRGGCATAAFAAIAAGRLDAYWAPGLKEWDYAAGLLLVTEAGGRAGRLDGRPVDPTGCLAAPAEVFDELAALLSRTLGR